jgi:hypothetical protein
MKNRSLLILPLFVFGLILIANSPASQAMPVLSIDSFSSPSPFLKVGHGCGWDYPCPPDPYYGRRFDGPPGSSDSDGYCEGSSCERCGPACWYHRFKQGYCGHGCEVYREMSYEEARRAFEYPHPFYDRSYAPRYAPPPYEESRPRYEHSGNQEQYPRRRFDGPRYLPDCSGGNC